MNFAGDLLQDIPGLARHDVSSISYPRGDQHLIFAISYSNISPGNGTLRVFPDVLLSNSYIILRPFFRPISQSVSQSLNAKDWVYGKLASFRAITHSDNGIDINSRYINPRVPRNFPR